MAYEQKLAAMVEQFFASQKWTYQFLEEEGFFESGVQLTEEHAAIIHAACGKAAMTVTVALDLSVPDEQLDAVRRFANLVNSILMMGGLILDEEEHLLYFRVGQNCAGQLPTAEIVEDLFFYPISFMDDLLPVLSALLAGTVSYEEAALQLFSNTNE